jgi:predicted dehydrogenase/threonine dehydrogenase-like Zn-dependent dehydrogenase
MHFAYDRFLSDPKLPEIDSMKQVLIKDGTVFVEEVAAPQVGTNGLLVRTLFSCISTGTELSAVVNSGMPLYRRALKQPEQARRVLSMMKEQGIRRTFDRVRGKLAAGSPSGYSAAGQVVAVGELVEGFSAGDLVACAGAGIANHAEVISVPVNLSVKVPSGASVEEASTVTLGAIAMQGVRRAQPTLGETFVVVGLGVIGQIAAQLLATSGCHVIGVDTDRYRLAQALENGLELGIHPEDENYVEIARRMTDGFGADAVVITAATASNEIVSDAANACRKKGRVVLVGDVGLHLRREDFYAKEIDFLISCSYGPGRYDPLYEEQGQDYPIGYVRWTENRNMEAYLRLIAQKRIRLGNLMGQPYELDRARDAYGALLQTTKRPVMAILSYPVREEALGSTVVHRAPVQTERIRVGLIGAGGFAQGMHLPNMVKLRHDYALHCVASRTGSNAKAIATRYEAAYSTTDYERVLEDPEVDLVLIATRHDLHARIALEALQAGKNVLVEKPLAITEDELVHIEDFFRDQLNAPMLCTGFNRRFSPVLSRAKDVLRRSTTPLLVNYRMNAGYIPLSHWVHGPEGGGRNIGEACHIYDLFNFLTAAKVRNVHASSVAPRGKHWGKNDNFVAVVTYEDGSACTLTYTAQGNSDFPKEQMEVFADGKVISMSDFKSFTVAGARNATWKSDSSQKGQLEELEAVAEALQRGAPWPIPLWQQIQATRISFEVERLIRSAESREEERAPACVE